MRRATSNRPRRAAVRKSRTHERPDLTHDSFPLRRPVQSRFPGRIQDICIYVRLWMFTLALAYAPVF
ncbi:protein of unknown function [Burkholderia multivorans]